MWGFFGLLIAMGTGRCQKQFARLSGVPFFRDLGQSPLAPPDRGA
jgi:hypothetical protein